MLLSNDDAKKKWCPFSRVVEVRADNKPAYLAPAHNRVQKSTAEEVVYWGQPTASHCIAEECMAWRWAGWDLPKFGTIAPNPTDQDKVGSRLGYCGLASKPYGAV